ncbi:hypothetical protein FGU65_05285 [Methanoculleus sp. FWC-SCC1]|uniref:Uncharacterized protein n=1 Tax=Methanoculleus frigidifontis TaxID=2584085 RepID=A0ABT8M8R6_9EURY|nr:hypothetical protein [Methanoculleus sp. FWC-SCC1]MDN7024310.1 hypothetical protein [Methanoculleus sp. FWC-SCC1]
MREIILPAGFVIGALAAAAASDIWYLTVILLGAFVLTERTVHGDGRSFSLLCAGEAVVVAAAAAGIAPALLLQVILLAYFLRLEGFLTARAEAVGFLGLCGAVLLLYPMMLASHHMLLPVLLIGAVLAGAYIALWLSGHQLKTAYSGGDTP